MKQTVLRVFVILGALAFAAGCETRQVVVEKGPPPARVEVIPPAPTPASTWTPGHWEKHHGRWVWINGMWVVPAQPAVVAAPVEVIVPSEPPAARVEVIPVAPSPTHVWTAGHWEWRHGAWVWERGVWAAPPHPHETWVPSHYSSGPHGWTYHPGHWRP